MSLIQEINRTNTAKEKTKTVATNIDSKLVELGGEQAIDLSDVPNKIDALIPQYSKYAEITVNPVTFRYQTTATIPLNVSFEPKEIFLAIGSIMQEGYGSSDSYQNLNRGFYITPDIKTFEIFWDGEKSSGVGFDITVKEFSKKQLILDIKSLDRIDYTFNFTKAYVLG